MPTATAPPPAKTASPPPTTTAGSPPPPPPGSSSNDPVDLGSLESELMEMDRKGGPSPSFESAPKRGNDGKFTKAEDKPEKPKDEPEPEKAPETPQTEEKPKDEPKPGTMRALGKAHDDLRKEVNTVYKPKIQSLESKVAEYETTISELRSKSPDLKPIQDKLSAVEKENQSLREAIRFADYRKSPEFIDKHKKPYEEAWTKAVAEVTQLNMEMEDGTVRKATANDLLALANAPLDQLDDLAQKWFPKSSARVIRHVEKVRDLADAQEQALKDAEKGAGEYQTKQSEERQNLDKVINSTYAQTNAELVKKWPKWFDKDEADPKGNDILQKGYDYASGVFENAPAQINGETRPLTPIEKVKRLAVIRAKAANHDRLAMRLKEKLARVEELEAQLAEYENSGPPTGEAGEPGGVHIQDWEREDADELKKLDR